MWKAILSISIIYLVVLMLDGCNHKNPQPSLKFKAYKHNPVLLPGKPGSWDELIIVAPNVILHDKVFYLFFTAFFQAGGGAIGLATSSDGYHFMKYPGNPIVSPDKNGFEAFGIGSSALIKNDSAWVMFYNASELPDYGPGPSIGRATSSALTGPWIKNESPVLGAGRKGEWDAGYIFPTSVIKNNDGTLMIYYTGSREQFPSTENYIGLATSEDGIHWKKYNDPATTQHPFAESDPVLKAGSGKVWDNGGIWTCSVYKIEKGFGMYYGGVRYVNGGDLSEFGFAFSKDGIHWEKFRNNPVYSTINDVFGQKQNFCEFPSICFTDSLCYLYYDYGSIEGKIGVATAKIEKKMK
jgi:predicted GH43/DUF377 family glycosyl hydrolase